MWKPRITWPRKVWEDSVVMTGDYTEDSFSNLVSSVQNTRLVIDGIEAWIPGNADNGSLTLTVFFDNGLGLVEFGPTYNFTQNQPLRVTDLNLVSYKSDRGQSCGFNFLGSSSASSLGSPGEMFLRIHYHEEVIR